MPRLQPFPRSTAAARGRSGAAVYGALCARCHDHTLGSSALLGGVSFLENYAFYVPYAAYAGALELLTGIFAEDDEVRMALREAAGVEGEN